MRGITDLRLLWVLGVVALFFIGIGLMAGATVIGLPLYMAAAMLGASPATMMKIFLYSAFLWAPIGAGAGMGAGSALLRGVFRKIHSTPTPEREPG